MRHLFAVALLLTSAPALAQAAPDPTPRDPNLVERAEIASAAYHIIKRYFAHAEGLPADYDFEAHYHLALSEALTAPDRRTFSLAMMRLFASLRNGHTGFRDTVLNQAAGSLPFRVAKVQDRWTVTRSRLPALPAGSVITMVDGQPTDEWLAPARAALGQSGPAALDQSTWGRAMLLPPRFTLTLDDGRTMPVDVQAPPASVVGAAGPARTAVTTRAHGVVVIRVPGFDEPEFEADAVAAIRANSDARAILLDLRGNGGGDTPVALLQAVMMRPYRGTMVVTPLTIAVNDARGVFDGSLTPLPTRMIRTAAERTQPSAGAWTGQLGVLADGGCASACEDFVIRFKDGGRGVVIGEATYGSTGQPYFVNYPQFGMAFQVSTKREFLPDGAPFEGVGVTPDLWVPLTRDDLRSPADQQLDKAAQLLLAQ